ncbi:hypothetical protein AAVH_42505 [Aphelenchoides avenae]|nr:hypothetical protein AAVH_42505 [Aphelenchus avenae]
MAKGSNNVKAAAHFEVYEFTTRRWTLNEAKLKAVNCHRPFKNKHGENGKRLKGGGMRVKDKEFDDNLARWVRKLRGNKLRVSRKMVQNEARKLVEKYTVEGDEGKPHTILSASRITTCQKPPEHYKEKVVSFIRYVEELRKAQNLCWEGRTG